MPSPSAHWPDLSGDADMLPELLWRTTLEELDPSAIETDAPDDLELLAALRESDEWSAPSSLVAR